MEKLSGRINSNSKNSKNIFSRHIISIAASLIFICVLALAFYQLESYRSSTTSDYVINENPKGEKSKIILPDGSLVWLNADSKISYPVNFEENREVVLAGEAFFEVKRDTLNPFIIHLEGAKVKVLGTSFNIKSYPGDSISETTVLSGKVAFIDKQNAYDSIILLKDEKVVYNQLTHQVETWQAENNQAAAWVEGKLVFDATPMSGVKKVLERWYNVDIELNEKITNCRITATFKEQPLEDVLTLISLTKEFNFSISDQQVFINGNECI
jgi:ferric-dicitrate binding protein FerR (iron transport regulator)